MNRFFINTLFTLLAATQLTFVNAMKRAHDDTIDLGTHSSAINFITTIKSLPPEMQLYAITWMLDVDTPQNLLNSLIMICNCALIDSDLNALTTDHNLGYCLKIRLHNTGQSLTTLLNANNETVLHLLARRPDFNARLFNVIQIAAGNQFNNLVVVQNNAQETAWRFVDMITSRACVQAILNTPGVDAQHILSVQNNNQYTALDLAQQGGHLAIVNLLQPYMHQNNH